MVAAGEQGGLYASVPFGDESVSDNGVMDTDAAAMNEYRCARAGARDVGGAAPS